MFHVLFKRSMAVSLVRGPHNIYNFTIPQWFCSMYAFKFKYSNNLPQQGMRLRCKPCMHF